MKKILCILSVLLCTVFSVSCASDQLMSLDQAIQKGESLDEAMLADCTKDELIAAWGEPITIKSDAEETLQWETEKGTVILSFEDGHVINAEAVTFHADPASSGNGNGGMLSVLKAAVCSIVPLLLFFVLISLLLRKLGWLGNDEKKDHGKEIFFSKPHGSKPWSGI